MTVPSEGMDITARRPGGVLIVAGRYKGEPYEQAVKAGGDPWCQFQELSLDGLAAIDEMARFWLRLSDGRYLRLEVDSVVELTREATAPDDRSDHPG